MSQQAGRTERSEAAWPARLSWVLVASAVVHGAARVWAHRWLCDDAFISFRYARNLADGHGLVFNLGERVEGYTNFLWTVLLAAGIRLGARPETTALALGALSWLATVGLLGWLSWRLFPPAGEARRWFLPLAALAVLLQRDYHVFATSGLEASFTALLALLGWALLVLGRGGRSALAAGTVLVLGAATRPDAILFYAAGLAGLLLCGGRPWRRAALYLAPLLLLYLPYWIARYRYYGYPFPNTYYAKSADVPYWRQGLAYLWLYFKAYYVLLPVLPVAVIVAARRGRSAVASRWADPCDRALLLAVLFVLPYVVFVARAGGDFMFARFLIPVTPLLFLALEIGVRRLLPARRAWAPVTLLLLAGVVLRCDPFAQAREVHFVTDESAFYPAARLAQAERAGRAMRAHFHGRDVRVAFHGMFAAAAYYAEPAVAIESNTGLTDTLLAHLPLVRRDRPGHEKPAPWSYLVQRRVNFWLRGEVPRETSEEKLRLIRFGDLEAQIVVYDRDLMDHLRQFPDVRFVDLPTLLDDYIARMSTLPDDRVSQAYDLFREYYFDHNADPQRQRPFQARLGG